MIHVFYRGYGCSYHYSSTLFVFNNLKVSFQLLKSLVSLDEELLRSKALNMNSKTLIAGSSEPLRSLSLPFIFNTLDLALGVVMVACSGNSSDFNDRASLTINLTSYRFASFCFIVF